MKTMFILSIVGLMLWFGVSLYNIGDHVIHSNDTISMIEQQLND
jgi:hypothetical protein